MQPYIQW